METQVAQDHQIMFVAHSRHVSQPFALCDFSIFKMLHERVQKTKRMKGETLKTCRAILAFRKRTAIPVAR
jgi:hypothetical protein